MPAFGLSVKNGDARVAQLINDKRPHEQPLRELYRTAFARDPIRDRFTALIEHLPRRRDELPTASSAIWWAILNTKAFQYNH